METFQRVGMAIVIEPQKDLADMVCDFLSVIGYEAFPVHNHAAGALHAARVGKVALLAACVPAPDEDRAEIFLQEAAKKNSDMAVVLMLSDTLEVSSGAPRQSVRIIKPFDRETLVAAIVASEKLTLLS